MQKVKTGIQLALLAALGWWCFSCSKFFPEAAKVIEKQEQSGNSLIMIAFLLFLFYFICDVCYVEKITSMVFSTIGAMEIVYLSTIIGELNIKKTNMHFAKALSVACEKTSGVMDGFSDMIFGSYSWVLYILIAFTLFCIMSLRFSDADEFAEMKFLGVCVVSIMLNIILFFVIALACTDADMVIRLQIIAAAVINIVVRWKYEPDTVINITAPRLETETKELIILGICAVIFIVTIIAGKFKSWSDIIQYMFSSEYGSLEENLIKARYGKTAMLLLMTIFISAIIGEIVEAVFKECHSIVMDINKILLAFLADVWIVEKVAASVFDFYAGESALDSFLTTGEDPVWIKFLSDANDKYLSGTAHDIGFGLIVLLLLFVIFMIGIIALCGIPVLISGFTYSLLVVFLSFFAYNFFNMENNKGTVSGIIFTMCMNAVIGTMAGYVIKFKKQSNSLEV